MTDDEPIEVVEPRPEGDQRRRGRGPLWAVLAVVVVGVVAAAALVARSGGDRPDAAEADWRETSDAGSWADEVVGVGGQIYIRSADDADGLAALVAWLAPIDLDAEVARTAADAEASWEGG